MLIAVNFELQKRVLEIDTFWLRDHCRCQECYNAETKQRKFNLIEIPANVVPKSNQYSENKCYFDVVWSDDHKSRYDLTSLHAALMSQVQTTSLEAYQIAWNSEVALKRQSEMRIKLTHLVASEQAVFQAVLSLVRYGLVFIEEVPPNTTMTEMAMRRLFPVMKTFFGEMFTFSDKQDHADSAYSKSFLGAHTDNTYFCDAAGLHSLHCIEHKNGTGGENFFVDGLNAVKELKRRNPDAYEVLSRVPVPAEYIEPDQHHTHTAPIIRTDAVTGGFVQLRLNVYDRATFNTIPQSEMADFYASLRELLQIIQSEENEWSMKLNPGTYVIFDNWRVLHARQAYTGMRTMTGCYVQRTDFLSRARTLGIIE